MDVPSSKEMIFIKIDLMGIVKILQFISFEITFSKLVDKIKDKYKITSEINMTITYIDDKDIIMIKEDEDLKIALQSCTGKLKLTVFYDICEKQPLKLANVDPILQQVSFGVVYILWDYLKLEASEIAWLMAAVIGWSKTKNIQLIRHVFCLLDEQKTSKLILKEMLNNDIMTIHCENLPGSFTARIQSDLLAKDIIILVSESISMIKNELANLKYQDHRLLQLDNTRKPESQIEIDSNNILSKMLAPLDLRADISIIINWFKQNKKIERKPILMYIDWQNINVPVEYIENFIQGIKEWAISCVAAEIRKIKIFLDRNAPNEIIIKKLVQHKIDIIYFDAEKKQAADAKLTMSLHDDLRGDLYTVCIVSGDQDFSPQLVRTIKLGHQVLLIYNYQARESFKEIHIG